MAIPTSWSIGLLKVWDMVVVEVVEGAEVGDGVHAVGEEDIARYGPSHIVAIKICTQKADWRSEKCL